MVYRGGLQKDPILSRIENETIYGVIFLVDQDVFGAKSGLPFVAEKTPGRLVEILPVINAWQYSSAGTHP